MTHKTIKSNNGKYLTVFSFLKDLQELLPVDVLSKVLLVFLYLADNEGCNQSVIARDLKLPASTTSRCVATLSTIGYKTNDFRTKGLGLVVVQEDPNDMRKKTIHLTSSGRAVLKALFHDFIGQNTEEE